MKYSIIETEFGWQVECVRHDLEGQIEVTLFTGYESEARARRYLVWMNNKP